MSIRDLLPLYALGAVDDAEARDVERAIIADPSLAEELDTLMWAAADLVGALPGVAPSPAVRARLLSSAAAPEGRFERFVERFAQLFEVATDRARTLLGLVDDPRAWEPGPGPGSWLLHFPPSPALVGADVGFVRLAPGQRFAYHRHSGREHSLVLSGRAHDSLAGLLAPGDEAIADGGTEHEFATVGDVDFIFAVWAWGVDFDVPKP